MLGCYRGLDEGFETGLVFAFSWLNTKISAFENPGNKSGVYQAIFSFILVSLAFKSAAAVVEMNLYVVIMDSNYISKF